jgi:hypothetical protein
VARHPALLWVGPLAACSWLTGKRPSMPAESAAAITVPA